ncbi:LuxR C-terminal-related transcriptional regulator [Agromyces sp. NPDC057865]|uniref:LuxR C-terminal-related transcriptional regulator n=1 Tax=Agromyces sp. NPDC057865 TaxID=3346267 RepID=UPI00366E6965
MHRALDLRGRGGADETGWLPGERTLLETGSLGALARRGAKELREGSPLDDELRVAAYEQNGGHVRRAELRLLAAASRAVGVQERAAVAAQLGLGRLHGDWTASARVRLPSMPRGLRPATELKLLVAAAFDALFHDGTGPRVDWAEQCAAAGRAADILDRLGDEHGGRDLARDGDAVHAALLLVCVGMPERAAPVASRSLEALRSVGAEAWASVAELYLAFAQLASGDIATALDGFRRADRVFRDEPGSPWSIFGVVNIVAIEALRGGPGLQLTEAEHEFVRRAGTHSSPASAASALVVLASALADLGDPASAHRVLTAAGSVDGMLPHLGSHMKGRALEIAGLAAAESGDLHDARGCERRLARLMASPSNELATRRLRLAIADAAGRSPRTARPRLAAASVRNPGIEALRARMMLLASCVAAGDRAGALAELPNVSRLATRLDAVAVAHSSVARVRTLNHGLAPARPLSRREREVAALVIAGWSNRRIAEALFLSVRTVESHVGRILRVYGVTRRAHLLGVVVEPVSRDAVADARLTERQSQVAHLIAAGASNAEIAVALSLRTKTVEKHVSSILERMGGTSRTQIAARVPDPARTGPTTSPPADADGPSSFPIVSG